MGVPATKGWPFTAVSVIGSAPGSSSLASAFSGAPGASSETVWKSLLARGGAFSTVTTKLSVSTEFASPAWSSTVTVTVKAPSVA